MADGYYAECHLCQVSLMLSVANHTFYAECLMLNVIMPSVVILNVMVPNIQHTYKYAMSFFGNILLCQIALYHPLDGITNHKDKLMHFLTTKLIFLREEGTSF